MIMLAEILGRSDDETKRELAKQYYLQAIQSLELAVQSSSPAPSLHLWLGMAYLGVGETDRARAYLDGALFLEMRPFYLAMTHLWMGKLADLEGDRQTAVEHYAEVLALASADYHQREANSYLETPFTR
jgi:tetratricopeptide (TPR) repeat protein